MSNVEHNAELVRRFIQALDTNELAVMGEICTSAVAEDWREGINNGQPFSDHHLEIEQIVADPENVMIVLGTRGQLVGEFHGIPPAGKSFTNRGAVYFRIEQNRISVVEPYFDDLHIVIDQLGATLTPPS